MAGNEVRIRVVADDRASKQIGSIRKESTGLGGAFQAAQRNWLALSAGIAGATGAVVAVKGLADAASDLAESQSKANVVFGSSVGLVNSFSQASATGYGIARQAALEATASFGNMFKTTGLAEQASASMSVTMTKLAADMASFNNEDPSDMLLRLRSGLAGEAEPLRRFGVLLSEAAVKAKAMELGIGDASGKLTEAEKVQARYALILEQTAVQQGDFARTSDGLANQQRILAAQMADLRAEIGTALLPVFIAVTKFANDEIIPAFRAFGELINDFEGNWQDAAQATLKAVEAMAKGFLELKIQVIKAFVEMVDAGLNFFLDKISDGLGKLGGLEIFGKKPLGFLEDLDLGVDISGAASILTAPDRALQSAIGLAFDRIRDEIGSSSGEWVGVLEEELGIIPEAYRTSVVTPVISGLSDVASTVASGLTPAVATLAPVVDAVGDSIADASNDMIAAADAVKQRIRDLTLEAMRLVGASPETQALTASFAGGTFSIADVGQSRDELLGGLAAQASAMLNSGQLTPEQAVQFVQSGIGSINVRVQIGERELTDIIVETEDRAAAAGRTAGV